MLTAVLGGYWGQRSCVVGPSVSSDPAEKQSAATLLMVRPSVFFANPETAVTNAFQRGVGVRDDEYTQRARAEFADVVEQVSRAGVEVIVEDASQDYELPDAIFPNNWFSTHADGTVVFYPMLNESRRRERRRDYLTRLERDFGFEIRRLVDLSYLECEHQFVEGTGSLVLDRLHRTAYCCLSPRSTRKAIQQACSVLGYQPHLFKAHLDGRPIYHTNVMMSIGSGYALICTGSVSDPIERARLIAELRNSGRSLVEITPAQAQSFAANVLELSARDGPVLAISTRAWGVLDPPQKHLLESTLAIRPVQLDTIEDLGGGGIRCMMAEIHLARRKD